MHSKVSSDWLPDYTNYIKATRPVLEILEIAGFFPESPRMLVYYETGRRKPTKYSKLVGLKAVIRIVESRRGIRLFWRRGGRGDEPTVCIWTAGYCVIACTALTPLQFISDFDDKPYHFSVTARFLPFANSSPLNHGPHTHLFRSIILCCQQHQTFL